MPELPGDPPIEADLMDLEPLMLRGILLAAGAALLAMPPWQPLKMSRRVVRELVQFLAVLVDQNTNSTVRRQALEGLSRIWEKARRIR